MRNSIQNKRRREKNKTKTVSSDVDLCSAAERLERKLKYKYVMVHFNTHISMQGSYFADPPDVVCGNLFKLGRAGGALHQQPRGETASMWLMREMRYSASTLRCSLVCHAGSRLNNGDVSPMPVFRICSDCTSVEWVGEWEKEWEIVGELVNGDTWGSEWMNGCMDGRRKDEDASVYNLLHLYLRSVNEWMKERMGNKWMGRDTWENEWMSEWVMDGWKE